MSRLRTEEGGLTIVEATVAAMILVVSSLAVLSVLDTSTRNTFRAQQSQVLINRLQNEMEKAKQLPFRDLALSSMPSHSSDQADPDWRVSGSNFAVNRDGTNPLAMVSSGSGGVAPGPTAFTSGNVKGKVYRYVVWDNDTSCPAPAAPCMKRAIVAVALDTTASGGARRYQELQAKIFDPAAKRSSTGNPNGPDTVPWTFWLTDTPCNNATRQPISGDHLAHNTRGACSTGKKDANNCTTVLGVTNCTPGAPDLMLPGQNAPDAQPLYDYANDVEPAQNPGNDRGLQLVSSSTCNTVSSLVNQIPLVSSLLDGQNYLKVHKWLSPAIPGGFNNILLKGSGTFNVWTQTVNGGTYNGKICVWLFTRTAGVDTPVVTLASGVDCNGTPAAGGLNSFTCSKSPWPSNGWTEISMPLNFQVAANLGGIALLPGTQLGVALAVDSSSGGGLQFMYDAPSYDSRLQVQTTGSLPF
jgi:type II secretory pathway pseudopilin PulG